MDAIISPVTSLGGAVNCFLKVSLERGEYKVIDGFKSASKMEIVWRKLGYRIKYDVFPYY